MFTLQVTVMIEDNRGPVMQRRMLDAIATIPGVESVGLTDALLLNDANGSNVFTVTTTDLRPSNAAADVYTYHVSHDYLRAEGTTLLSGRAFTSHDDKDSPRVAVRRMEPTSGLEPLTCRLRNDPTLRMLL